MKTLKNILQHIKNRLHLLVLLASVLLLSACHDSCQTIQDYINNGIRDESCILCQLFDIFIDTAIDLAEASWEILSKPLIPVVAVVTAIYVAIYTLKLVGSFGKQTATDFMAGDRKGLLMLMFKMSIIIFLLKGSYQANGFFEILSAFLSGQNFFVEKIISPILVAGLEIGQELAISPGSSTNVFYDGIENLIMDTINTPWASLFEKIRSAIYGFNAASYETIGIGEAMICNATEDSILDWYYLMILYGCILFIFGWLMLLAISFYMIDTIINLTFGAILLPFGIACAISNITVSYSKNIWNIFINTFFNFVVLGIIIGLSIQMVILCIQGGSDIEATGGALSSFMSNKDQHLNDNQIEALSEELWSNGSLLLTIVCFSVLICLIPKVGDLAKKISGAAGLTSAASKTVADASKVMMGGAKRASKQAHKRFIKPALSDAGRKMYRAARLDKVSQKITSLQGYLTGTGAQGHRAFWR